MASIRSRIGENMEDRYLFKAKRLDNHYWILGFLSVNKTGKYFIRPICGSALSSEEVDKNTICQCTGLKDRNGKLVWENDIVHNGNYFVVKWNLSCARFDFALNNSHNIPVGRWEPMIIDWKNSDFKEYRNNIDFEVIGNIFDNPELLE